VQAVDTLRDSWVTVEARCYTFAGFYETFVDQVYADAFLADLWAAENVGKVGNQRRAEVQAAIREQFRREGWVRSDLPETRSLLAYVLYWWTAFATGYVFEAQILQDLEQSGIEFQAHDPRRREERYAPVDLTVAGLTGDVKSSGYFFFAPRSASLPHDFYITRYYDPSGQRYQRLVILRAEHWPRFNGEVPTVAFPSWTTALSRPVRFPAGSREWVALGYEEWKQRVLRYQREGGDSDGRQNP
jgi:hypothetical protein